ncbi:hypothetical protein FJ976_17280 [Mesorhizobium sp. B1-1-9]|uniref:hypothetical protein n=1 Tax=Mesorhizobium sp. B1-1-9 TaxID=2589975 RepID=UPI001126618C|nr:hypothetical protein [Mesorhizobium sp. B1-1-9]TPN49482.1 hypothetical protein FJ976_17280 [Mesorhizobium sp. B1-1-9]
MGLNPELRDQIMTAVSKYKQAPEAFNEAPEPPRGIIPFEPLPEEDPRMALIFEIAWLISDALSAPAVGVYELSEEILDTVEEALM